MRNAGAKGLLLLAGCMTAVTSAQVPRDDLKPFPAAAAGQQRIVIRLPEVADPDDLKVEVMIGKAIMVDCNLHSFAGNVTREEAKGWGFSYYVLDALRGPNSTMMACPPGAAKHEQFARIPAEILAALRYNSRVPIVIYVPADAQVRYRIWSADSETRVASAE
jgi:ecotin